MMLEHFFQCPYCWEEISMLLDKSTSETYIEDCEICCNPLVFELKVINNHVVSFSAVPIGQ